MGSIVCRTLHLKHINEGGSALRSKHAVPRTKEPSTPSSAREAGSS